MVILVKHDAHDSYETVKRQGIAPARLELLGMVGKNQSALPRTPQEEAGVVRFKHLTEVALPALARAQRWPIRLDHCFKRICLDDAFKDVWYNHLPRPAERHLAGTPLARAVGCAEAVLRGGLPVLTERNQASLRYRGKLRPSSDQPDDV